MFRSKVKSLSLMVITVLFLLHCSAYGQYLTEAGQSASVSSTAFSVVSTNPADGGNSNISSLQIQITFSKEVDLNNLTVKTAFTNPCEFAIYVSVDSFSNCIPFTGQASKSGNTLILTISAAQFGGGETVNIRLKKDEIQSIDADQLSADYDYTIMIVNT